MSFKFKLRIKIRLREHSIPTADKNGNKTLKCDALKKNKMLE